MSLRAWAAAFAVACAACGGGEPRSATELAERVPDAEGVAVEVTPDRIRLDGDRLFRIDPAVESFTAAGLATTPLLRWKGRYVHVGLDDADTVVWVSGVGIVAQTEPPVVMYTGVVRRRGGGRIVFEDGTVLRLAGGVRAPGAGTSVVARIDPAQHVVTEVREQR